MTRRKQTPEVAPSIVFRIVTAQLLPADVQYSYKTSWVTSQAEVDEFEALARKQGLKVVSISQFKLVSSRYTYPPASLAR